MKKNYFILISIITIGAIILMPIFGCKKKEERDSKLLEEKKAMIGDLHLAYVSPQGNTASPHQSETIVVIFDQAMVPLEALAKDSGSSLLQLEPSFSGKTRWLNPKTLTFTPNNRFPFSTEIKATIPAETKSLEGYILREDFSWTFRTILPRLVNHFPRNKEKWVKLDSQILLVFNQPIQKNKAMEFLTFIEIDSRKNEIPRVFKMKTPSTKQLEENEIKASPDEVLLIVPQEPLEPDFSYYIEIKSGFSGKEGSLGMEKSRIFQFETFKKFEFQKFSVKETHNPLDPLQFQFSNPVVFQEFVKKIRFEPEIAIPDYYSQWEQSNSSLWINLPFQPETKYTLWISPELEDEFGSKLGKEVNLVFATSAYSPSVEITEGHGILETYGDLKFPVHVVNSPEIFCQAGRVKKNNVIPLLSTKNLFWSSKRFFKKNFFQMEKTFSPDLPRNKRQAFPIDLSEITTEKYGLILLQLDTHLQDKWSRYPKAFIQVTELGISAKFSAENNLIWVTELQTGLPVQEAEVEIRDDFNKICWKGKTDEEGKAQTPGWKELKIRSKDKWSKPQQWVFVQKGKDLAFSSSEWGTGVYPYHFGIQYDWNPEPEKYQGYIFTERGIYRAGEKIHIKGIIRERVKNDWKLSSIKNIRCEIFDPFQKRIFTEKISLDSYSSFTLDYETNEEAALGYYNVKATLRPESKEVQGIEYFATFRVEAFRTAEYEVHLRSMKETFFFGEEYLAEMRANYLFGGTMADQKASWHLRLNPTSFAPPGHEGYTFGNQIDRWETYGEEDSRLLSSGESSLDKEGKLRVSAKLQPEKEKDSVLAALEATVQGPSRRSVSNRIQTIVHRGKYYIGLSPNTTFLPKGKEIAVNVISVNPDGTPVAEKKIQLSLIKREWHSVRKAEIGGRYGWRSEKKDIEIETRSLQTKNEPQQVPFIPEKSGFYLLRAEGKDRLNNLITTTAYFYVTGSDYIPWERQEDDSVEIVSDRTEYRPGEVAKILVKSPYERAKALVTIEREFILENRIVEIQGSTGEIEIPLLSEYIPNVYVSVLLVHGRASPQATDDKQDLGKPSYKIGYIQLNVDPSEKRLEIEIKKDKETYKPGEKVALEMKVKDWKDNGTEANLSIAVVDLGVLSLIGYKTPDPFSQFYSQKSLSVQTSETRQHIIEQIFYGDKGDDIGGGEGERLMAAAAPSIAEVELRGDFRLTAYWNPSTITDKEGKATVSFTLPDNLTTFRIMAIAQTIDSRFGRTQTNFKVTKPLLLQAALPRFARIGDEFDGGIVLHNQSSLKGAVTLSCEVSGITLLEKTKTKQFSLEPGEGREVLFSFKADEPGTASLAFRARMGEESDGLEIFLPIKMPRPTESVALFEITTESTEEKIRIPENVYPFESKIEFLAACSALSGLKGSVDYLTDYPYLCLEQRLSSIIPYIVAHETVLDFKLSRLNKEEIQEHIQETIKEIYAYQRENGGFGLWPDSRFDSPFNSCYAVFAMAKARQIGFDVDDQRLERAKMYLQNLVRGRLNTRRYPYNKTIWNTIKSYALYSLALLNQPEPSYAEKLFSEREDLSLFGKTLLLKAMNQGEGPINAQNTLIQEMMNMAKVSPTHAHFEERGSGGRWIYSSNQRTTAFILQSLIEVGSDSPLLPSIARWLVERRKTGGWSSTQENAYVFYALNEFYRKYENIKPDFKVEVSLAEKLLFEEIFKDELNKVRNTEISLSQFYPGETIPLKIKKTGDGTLYYETRMTYAPQGKLNPRDEGFTVYKEITSLDGKPLNSIKAGSLVAVTLQVIVPKESLFIVLDDPLPAGLEAVNPTFLTESEEQQRKLEELPNEERQRRWWRGFNHIEMHDDRVLLFADSLLPGIHTHRYLARALTMGIFNAPGTKIEEMYSPEVFGRSSEITLKIVR